MDRNCSSFSFYDQPALLPKSRYEPPKYLISTLGLDLAPYQNMRYFDSTQHTNPCPITSKTKGGMEDFFLIIKKKTFIACSFNLEKTAGLLSVVKTSFCYKITFLLPSSNPLFLVNDFISTFTKRLFITFWVSSLWFIFSSPSP